MAECLVSSHIPASLDMPDCRWADLVLSGYLQLHKEQNTFGTMAWRDLQRR